MLDGPSGVGAPVAPNPVNNGNAGPANARQLVDQATDPRTGAIDTRQLARLTAGATRQDPARGQAARAEIEAELFSRNAGDASRFQRDYAEAASNWVPGPAGLSGAAQGMADAGRRTLVNNPILSVQWENTASAWTNRAGFTPGARTMLEANGLDVRPNVNPVPQGSRTSTSGTARPQANNINGALARDAIADRYRAQGYGVQTEVTVQNGQRRLDVVAQRTTADPRMGERIEVESKVGRTANSATIRGQAALDSERLVANQTLRNGGRVLEGVGRVARPVGVALDVIEVGQAFRADGNRVGANTGRAASSVAGGAAGGWGGAAAGAAIGTAIFPGVGTVVGGVVGAGLGAWGGSEAGKGVFDTVRGWFH